LWCSQTGDHPQEDLAKFGHIPHVKVEKIKICLYFGYMMEPDIESWRLIFLFFYCDPCLNLRFIFLFSEI
jgi:hypothetical protein